jgi:predicted RNA methylase
MKDRDGKLIWYGLYDLYQLWNNFGIPDDLKGQSVIDIGAATGFFAFECEKRCASPVVATELSGVKNSEARSGARVRRREYTC